MNGKLFLVPTPLDFGCGTQTSLEQVLPAQTIRVAAKLSCWLCENAKTTRAFLKRVQQIVPLSIPMQALDIRPLPHGAGNRGGSMSAADAAAMKLSCSSPSNARRLLRQSNSVRCAGSSTASTPATSPTKVAANTEATIYFTINPPEKKLASMRAIIGEEGAPQRQGRLALDLPRVPDDGLTHAADEVFRCKLGVERVKKGPGVRAEAG